MDQPAFDFEAAFTPGLPASAARFGGFPRFNFIGGHNDPAQIPIEGLIEAATTALRRDGAALALYNMGHGPQGYRPLRQFLSDKLARVRGIQAGADDILVTSGSGQGIDMVTRLLVRPGDCVIAEEFSYGGALNRMRAQGAKVIGAKVDQDGIDMTALRDLLAGMAARGEKPRFIYTIPTIQNPTGSVLPLDRRHALLELSREFAVPIFEDECYADLTWALDAPPSLAALDPGRVIHIGSFSKSLAPALRVGYAVAPWPVLSRLIACKSDGGTGALDQMVAAEFFTHQYDAHMTRLHTALSGKLAAMTEAVAAEFGTAAEMFVPKGGIFLWLRLPDGVDVRRLVAPAAAAGLVFNPGPEWACDAEAAASYLRLCFALPDAATIRDGVATLARVCFEQTGIPERGANKTR